MIDVTACGTHMSKTPEAAYALMEELASNNHQWTTSKRTKSKPITEVIEVDQVSRINARFAILNKRFDNLEKMSVSIVQATKTCKNYLGEYTMVECPCRRAKTTKQVAYMENSNQLNNPY